MRPRIYLTDTEWAEAVRLWRAGYDTLAIARQMNARECVIYNRLPLWRALERENAG